MIDDQFTPEEQQIIQRLRDGSAPEMKPETVERLRQQMMAEMDVVFAPDKPQPILNPTTGGIAAVIVLIAVLVIMVALLLGGGVIGTGPVPTATATPTHTPTATITPTVTLTPTTTVTPSLTPTASMTPTAAATLPPTQPAALSLSPTAVPATSAARGDDPLPIVIEGPVMDIGEGYIIIFDVTIRFAQSDVQIERLRIGDVVRVEGRTHLEGASLIVDAVRIAPAVVESGAVPPAQSQPGHPPPPPPPPAPDDRDRSSRSS